MTSLDSPTRCRPNAPTGRPPVRTVVAAITALALGLLAVLVAVVPGGAQDPSGDPARLVSVRFDLAPPGDGEGTLTPVARAEPVRYAAAQIAHRGVARRLRPAAGVASASVAAGDPSAVTVEVDGLRMGPSADGYAAALVDAVGSPVLRRFARIGGGGEGSPISLDLQLDRPIGADHYLLIQEAGGDAEIEVEALAAGGVPTGVVGRVAAPYQWNSGHQVEAGIDQWASVISAPLPADGGPITGLRLRTTGAEVKIVVLGPAVDTPPEAAAAAAAAAPASQAQIDLVSGVLPAVAVGGAGCEDALGEGAALHQGNEAVTFCFAVTNSGDVPVGDITITDPRAGLVEARLARASGPEVLAPGDRAVLYHHTTPVLGAGEVVIRAAGVASGRPVGVSAVLPAGPSSGATDLAGAVAASSAANPVPATEVVASGASAASSSAAASSAASSSAAASSAATSAAGAEVTASADSSGTGSAETGSSAIGSVGPGSSGTGSSATGSAAEASGAGRASVASSATPAALAMTGVPTEPWTLVGLATGLIFFGYTAVAAFRRPSTHRPRPGEVSGHTQLDALGFD